MIEAAIACLPPADTESVSLTYDADLPVVWADHDRMEQVFVNLLNNAVGHNPPGTSVRVTATMAGEPQKPEEPEPTEQAVPQVVISVLDDGLGMPPELVAAPFEPARRPSPRNGAGSPDANHGAGHAANGRSSRKSAGAGLGLSIARGIVQAHGGRIELTGLRKGTCFSVYLPVEAGNGGPAAAQRAMEFTGASDD